MAKAVYELMTGKEMYSNSLEINEMPTGECFGREKSDRIPEAGHRRFKPLLDSEADYDEENGITRVTSSDRELFYMGFDFTELLCRAVDDKLAHVWFHFLAEVCPCDCAHGERSGCNYCDDERRNLEIDGGKKLCPLFKELWLNLPEIILCSRFIHLGME